MKFALPDFRAAKAWIPERLARFIRHYSKEIVIAIGARNCRSDHHRTALGKA